MTLLLPSEWSPPSSTTAITLTQQPPPPEDPGGQGEDFGKSSPVALVVLVLFFLAVVLLVRSMNKHLRRVPASFDRPEAGAENANRPGPHQAGSDAGNGERRG